MLTSSHDNLKIFSFRRPNINCWIWWWKLLCKFSNRFANNKKILLSRAPKSSGRGSLSQGIDVQYMYP